MNAQRTPEAAIVGLSFLMLALGCGNDGLKERDGAADAAQERRNDARDDGAAAVADGAAGAACELGRIPLSACGVGDTCGTTCAGQCVDVTSDPANCGRCGHACAPTAACLDGACGVEVTRFVAPAPGCLGMQLVHEAGQLYWADAGHGSIQRMPTTGGPATPLVTNAPLAVLHPFGIPYDSGLPVTAPIIVRDGTVIFIGAGDTAHMTSVPNQICSGGADGGTVCMNDGTSTSILAGGVGTTIQSVTGSGALKVLLPATLVPAVSPVSSGIIEDPTRKPDLGAVALSPDGSLIYFGAGTRLYSMPSAGAVTAADVKLVGVTWGPELGVPTSLVASDHQLIYPTIDDAWVELFDLDRCGNTVYPAAGCAVRLTGTHVDTLLDTLVLNGHTLAWAHSNGVYEGDITADATDALQSVTTTAGGEVMGFGVGPTRVYFGDGNVIERGVFEAYADGAQGQIIARGQNNARGFALDGSHVFWTTDDCDVAMMPDAPQ